MKRLAPRALATFALMSVAVTAPAKPPIPTRREDVVDNLHGVAVADPYRWLEDGASPEVQQWTAAENAATKKALDAYPGRAALASRLWELYEIGSLGTPAPRRHGKGWRYFYT